MNRTSACAAEARGGRLAYILDDEPEIREFITYIVNNAGFCARAFSDQTSLELALTEAVPEVIILDLSLGNSDGIDVIRSLAASRFGGAIMLVSGRHDAKTIDEVGRIGTQHGLVMLPFLQKPFRLDQLKQRLRLVAQPAVPSSEADFEDALRNNQLELWYQPKVDLQSHHACGAEALIRLRHPTRGVLLPSAFLPPSGDALHRTLADFVIRRVVTDWLFFAADQVAIKLSINMPMSVFETTEFVGSLRKYLPRTPEFPGLIVELTEDEVIKDPDFAREVAIQLKLYNVEVAIDDFGSGYSTLKRAHTLPFSELKIDRSKVDGCSRIAELHWECRNIVDLAHRLGMIAVAEGIETGDDLQALIEMKCDVGQGLALARPMEREAFKRWVRQAPGST